MARYIRLAYVFQAIFWIEHIPVSEQKTSQDTENTINNYMLIIVKYISHFTAIATVLLDICQTE